MARRGGVFLCRSSVFSGSSSVSQSLSSTGAEIPGQVIGRLPVAESLVGPALSQVQIGKETAAFYFIVNDPAVPSRCAIWQPPQAD
jgi:hypothetical protein